MSKINVSPNPAPIGTGDQKAANGSLLIVGIGGLGVPAAMAAVRAGVARLGLIDPDPVELSNLHRQVIYTISDIGMPKVTAAERRLHELGVRVEIETHHLALDPANARSIIASYDFTIDATDSPLIKFLINDTCVALGRPFAYGGVLGMTGQTMTILPGRSACLRCLFEEPPDEDEIASCRDAGIVGPIAGAIGEAQAAEAISYLRRRMPALAGKMLTYEANGLGRIRLTPIAARPGCSCGAAKYPSRLKTEPWSPGRAQLPKP
jgi:molybdopterin/thiamine biosynthesis adenylyltransferase